MLVGDVDGVLFPSQDIKTFGIDEHRTLGDLRPGDWVSDPEEDAWHRVADVGGEFVRLDDGGFLPLDEIGEVLSDEEFRAQEVSSRDVVDRGSDHTASASL